MNFKNSTRAQNIAELRRRFKAAKGVEAAKIARWLRDNATVAELKAAFAGDDAKANALKTKLKALADQQDAIDAAAGE